MISVAALKASGKGIVEDAVAAVEAGKFKIKTIKGREIP
eukprot:CAMPEP_0176252938 /NCGR_PEP_ID=MMETSP0121_2-20121125/35761_1 /TAXON_ID=160619 /ORGANISM="Kryptoperidinium foliaceum, Strain CCMP 1326" /LENGTH=38 /DNA_ID= /DNA_START= /DNA_END= /DNA_ORIENTATION=